MKNQRVLVSGAGIAGLTLAYWLKRFGFVPTLVEQAPQLRTGGYKIDIRGAALQVVQWMDLSASISASKTNMRGATIVDKNGNRIAKMSGDTFGLRVSEDLEIVRGDLCHILAEKIRDVEFLFDNSIRSISQDSQKVEVEFEKGTSRTFDLVIGTDGLHSVVRKLIFGSAPSFTKELGLYISIFTVPNYLALDGWEIEYADSKKLVNLYSTKKEVPRWTNKDRCSKTANTSTMFLPDALLYFCV